MIVRTAYRRPAHLLGLSVAVHVPLIAYTCLRSGEQPRQGHGARRPCRSRGSHTGSGTSAARAAAAALAQVAAGRIGAHPAFRVLAGPAAFVYEQLAAEPVRVFDLRC